MSWWDTFSENVSNWWDNANKPAFTQQQSAAIAQQMPGIESDIAKGQAEGLPIFYAAKAAADARGIGPQFSNVQSQVQSPIGQAMYAPVRWTQEQIAALELSAITHKNFFEARDIVQGDRPADLPFWYSGENTISLGQTNTALAGSLGLNYFLNKDEINKIDWTNSDQVQGYFNHGPQQWLSGTTDLITTVALDPVIIGGAAVSKIRVNTFVRPVTEKTFTQTMTELDNAAVGSKSNWNPFINDVIANAGNPKAIMGWTKVLESSNVLDLAGTLSAAAKYGRQAVVDVIKVATGNATTLEELVQKRSEVTGQVAHLQLQLDKLKNGQLALPNKNLVNLVKNKLAIKKAEEESLLRVTGESDVNKLLANPDMDAILKDSPIFGSMMNRTVSKYVFAENLAGKFAKKRAEVVFDTNVVKVDGIPTRILTWLNPSGAIKEAPSGMMNTGNFSAAESFREMYAIARRAEKKTGVNYQQEFNDYVNLPQNASQRNAFLAGFEKRIQEDILVKKIFADKHPIFKEFSVSELRNLTREQRKRIAQMGYKPNEVKALLESSKYSLEAISTFVDSIISTKNRLASRTMRDAIDENYVVYDGTGDPTVVAQYKDYLNQVAERENISFSQLVKQLADEAQYGTHEAPFYGFMDIDLYNQVLTENSTPLRYMLNILEDQANIGLSKEGLREAMDNVVKQYEKNPNEKLSPLQAGWKGTKESYDLLIHMTDSFYGTIWKPLTLISLKYGARNVLEGSQRMIFAMNDLAMMTNESRLTIAADVFGNPVKSSSRILKNIISASESKVTRRINSDISTENLGMAKAWDLKVDESLHLGVEPNFALAHSLADDITTWFAKDKFFKRQKSLWQVPGTKTRVRTVYKSITDPDTLNVITHVLNGDNKLAAKVLFDAKDLSTVKLNIDTFRAELEKILSQVDIKLADKKYMANLSAHQTDLLTKYKEILINLPKSLDNAIESVVASNIAWEKYDSLLAGTNPILIMKNDGTYVKGRIQFSDAFDGLIGKLAAKESSANKTAANAIFQSNRQLGETALSAYKHNTEIDKYSPRWASEYTTYVNNILRNDKIMFRLLEGKTSDAELANLIMSPDFKGYRTTVGLSDNATAQMIKDHLTQRKLQIAKDVPEIAGMKNGWLKEQIVNGTFTEETALNIPPYARVTVSGTDLVKPGGIKNLGYWWARATETAFKYVGTLPETALSRHPMYRAVYRAEGRRLFKILEKQGKDPFSPASQELIRRAAHRRAFKTLNETLYTIERRTDPAEFMRFMSPFYMAQQNSVRFWLGETFKNPTLPYIGLLAWNTPNRVLNMTDWGSVVDENGNEVDFSFPTFSNEQIEIVLPEAIAKFFHQERLSISKSSMDLITQGTMPIPMLSVSGPVVSMPASYIINQFDVAKMATDMGLDGNFIETKVLPYFDPYKADTLEGALPMPAWMRSVYNAFGWTPQSAARVNLLFEQKMREADEAGIYLSDEQRAQLMKEAAQEAKSAYLWEAAFSGVLPFSTKLKSQEDILHREWLRYLKRDGNINGPINFAKAYGEVKTAYASSSLSENPAGLMATPQTEANLKQHMDLASELAASTNANGFKMLGWLFNEGDASDYSKIVNANFYDLKIAGVSIKQQNENLGDAQRSREENIGWSKWIPFKQLVTAIAEAKGIKPGTAEWDAKYKPILDAEKLRIGTKYPAWLQTSASFATDNGSYNFFAMQNAIYNKSKLVGTQRVWAPDSYMETVGAKNQIAQAMVEWIPFRNALATIVLMSGYSIDADANKKVRDALAAESARLSAKYPSFAAFYERVLANDTLKTAQSLGLKVK